MHDFDLQRCTRRCAATGRELAPRETIYSKLVDEVSDAGRDFVRYDYCQSAWRLPAEGEYVSWWKWTLPAPGDRKVAWAPHEVLLRFFEGLLDEPNGEKSAADQRSALRYVTALLLVRRRIARIQKQETQPEGGQRLVLFSAQTEREYGVTVAPPTPDEAAAIQRELINLLTANSPSAPSANAPSQTVEAGP